MSTDDQGNIGLARKTTRLLTNAEEIVQATAQRCCGGHAHVHLISGRAKYAAVYPPKCCRAVLKEFCFWRWRRAGGKEGQPASLNAFSKSDLCDPTEEELLENSGQFVDDIKGAVLDSKLTQKARDEEMEVFIEREVYELVPKSKLPRNAKIIGARRVDTNKGTEAEPRIRSRLVAQEFNPGGDPDGDLFAPNPPLGRADIFCPAWRQEEKVDLGHTELCCSISSALFYMGTQSERFT